MKKFISALLVFCLLLGLCACGAKAPKLKAEDLVGEWSQSLWFFTTKMVMNSNGTYDYGEDKGTFTVNESTNVVKLTPRSGDSSHTEYKYFNGYLYCTSRCFAKDMEYGLGFSPDENGVTDQRFTIALTDARFDPNVEASSIELEFEKDGTFSIFTSVFRYSKSLGSYFNDKPFNNYKGTYKYSDSILTLTLDGVDHPLVVIDGTIYYITYSK